MRVLILSTILSEKILILRIIQRDIFINVQTFLFQCLLLFLDFNES